jgi:hypothetical protein
VPYLSLLCLSPRPEPDLAHWASQAELVSSPNVGTPDDINRMHHPTATNQNQNTRATRTIINQERQFQQPQEQSSSVWQWKTRSADWSARTLLPLDPRVRLR